MVHAIMGDPAHIRGIPFLANGEIQTVQSRPYRVLEDSEEVVALYMPEGTATQRWHIMEGRYLPEPPVSQGETLRLLYPGAAYDVTLFFEGGGRPPWFYDGCSRARDCRTVGASGGAREERVASSLPAVRSRREGSGAGT
jgi:hypothetical protein